MTSVATEAAASAGRALAALRHSQSYTCAVCGQPFEAKRRTGPAEPRYCSEACKQRAKYRRERQRAEQVGRERDAEIAARIAAGDEPW